MLMLLVVTLTCQLAFCQTHQDIIEKYKGMAGVEFNELPKELLQLAAAGADANTKEILNRIEVLKLLQVNNGDEQLISDILADVKKLEIRYNKLAEENDEGNITMAYIYGDDDYAEAMVVVQASSSTLQFIVLEGKIKMSDLESLGSVMGD